MASDEQTPAVQTPAVQELPSRIGALEERIDHLQHRLEGCAQDQDEFRSVQSTRTEAVDSRMTAFESVLRKLESSMEEHVANVATEMEENNTSTRKMLSQAVNRIADQFDAVQISLENAIKAREQDREAMASSQEEHNKKLHDEIDKRFEEIRRKADETEARQSAGLSSYRENSDKTFDVIFNRIDQLECVISESEERQLSSAAAMKEALTLWQQGLETQMNSIAAKYDEYKQYTARLRKEVHHLREENNVCHEGILKVFSQHANGLQDGVGQLQQDAVALLKVTKSLK